MNILPSKKKKEKKGSNVQAQLAKQYCKLNPRMSVSEMQQKQS